MSQAVPPPLPWEATKATPRFKNRDERDAFYRAKYYAETEGVQRDEPLTIKVPASVVPVLSAAVRIADFGVGTIKIIWNVLALLMFAIILSILLGIAIS